MEIDGYSAQPAKSDIGVSFAQAFVPFAKADERGVAAIDPIVQIAVRVWNRLALRSRERAAISALAGLESHTLKDIGIGRSEIRYLARETARRGGYDRSAARRGR